MEILADDADYKVQSRPGELVVTRAEDGKVCVLKGRGMKAQFLKGLREYGNHRTISMFIRARSSKEVVWQ